MNDESDDLRPLHPLDGPDPFDGRHLRIDLAFAMGLAGMNAEAEAAGLKIVIHGKRPPDDISHRAARFWN